MNPSHSARHGVRWKRLAGLAALLAANAAAQAQGLQLHPPEGSVTAHSPSEYTLSRLRMPTNSIRLFGDYYLFDPGASDQGPLMGSLTGGFRISTGIAGLGQTTTLFDTQPDTYQNLPYLGLGYSHLWFKSQLSLNADFGLASQNAGALGHARGLLNGSQSLDDIAHDLRWGPVMAVNVSYSF